MNTNTNETPAAAKPEVAEFRLTLWTSKKPDFEKKVAHLNRILKKHGKTPITFRYENVRSEMVKFQYHIKGEAFANDEYKEFSVEVCDAVCEGITIVKKDDAEYVYLGTVSFVEGVKQVSGAIAASTLTTISVFLPIVFVQGMARDLFADMGLTIAYSLMASLVVAISE